MKLRFNGTSPVLAPGTEVVINPGDVVELPDDVAESLLGAGAAHGVDDTGAPTVTPAVDPLWSRPKTEKHLAGSATEKKED